MGYVRYGSLHGFYPRVEVRSISPTYYAKTDIQGEYQIRGYGLNLIPAGALGITAYANSNPEQYINTQLDDLLMDIIVVDSHNAIARPKTQHQHSSYNCYLGCIVTEDRQEIWVNNTRPLP